MADTYVPPTQAFCYILLCSDNCFWLKWIPVDKVTQNLGFSIPFHLYIHDHDSNSAGLHLLEGWTHTSPLFKHFATYYCVRLPVFGSNGYQLTKQHKILILASISTSTFMIMTQSWQGAHLFEWRTHTSPFHRHFATCLLCSDNFFWLKWIPVDKVTQNLGFSIPFHLYIHDHDSKLAGCTLI